MVRLCSYRLILPLVGLSSLVYGVSNSEPGNQEKLLQNNHKNKHKIDVLTHKGCRSINRYGWHIIKKWDQPLNVLQLDEKDYPIIKYFPHPTLNFAIFKVDFGSDNQKEKYDKFENLATQKDLEYLSHWVTSYGFFPDSLTARGIFSDKSIENNSKVLSGISKIESQKNGRLTLSRGTNIEKFYEEIWSEIKYIWSNLCLANSVYTDKNLLNNLEYKKFYLNSKIDQLNQSRDANIKLLIQVKGRLIQVLDQALSNSDVFNALASIRKEVNNLDQKIKDLQNRLRLKPEEISHIPVSDQESLWQEHLKELKRKQGDFFKKLQFCESIPPYGLANPDQKLRVYEIIMSTFRPTYLGVADKEDNGGMICVPSKDSVFCNLRYNLFYKIVGITDIRENDPWVPGENSFAIDLTTPEVRQWISETMDKYYEEQNGGSSSRKRSVEGSDNGAKKIKQEPTAEEDLARSLIHLRGAELIELDEE